MIGFLLNQLSFEVPAGTLISNWKGKMAQEKRPCSAFWLVWGFADEGDVLWQRIDPN